MQKVLIALSCMIVLTIILTIFYEQSREPVPLPYYNIEQNQQQEESDTSKEKGITSSDGTLAIVLAENNEAVWTIGLGDDFYFDQNTTDPPTGEIILYPATLVDNKIIRLQYQGEAPLR
ncbi:hypothetical protein [Gracilibacillus thailandensis]|uniref:hypothetical protein n=1 Tax=Gracilibacillus thailandensis TaxID=563735 RepID=UPI00189217B2|nr:hypothetical protein [Gracilibacillus thailandensis]